MMSRFSPGAALVLCALGVGACSEAGIEPIDDSTNHLVDDKLEIKGQVCTSDPSEAVFPVKILLIVDCSGSMQFTDPASANTTSFPGAPSAQQQCLASCSGAGQSAAYCTSLCNSPAPIGRQAAVRKLVDRFKNNPAVSFAVIRFNGRVTINGSADPNSQGFTNNPAVLDQAITSLSQAEILTDYQGALSAAHELLLQDMNNTSPADRVRTKYVVIFFSDGAPNPVCKEGCGNDKSQVAGIVTDNWCDLPRDEWCDAYNYTDPQCKDVSNWYPAMQEPCRAYNSKEQILQKVYDIMDLGLQYAVGEIRFHTALLYVEGLPQAIQDLVGGSCNKTPTDCNAPDLQTTCPTGALLCDMAKAGDGLFRAFSTGQQIDFLSINYSTVARPFGMTNLIVTNPHAVPYYNKLLIDTDGDGLDDQLEFEANLGLKEKVVDSDGDGYGDKLEYDRREAGFDPADPNKPVKICLDKVDTDGDGLTDCEEKILGTDSRIADTDRDRIPDGLEFRWGTNPLRDDAKVDVDFDGKLSGEEIRIHASPVLADPEVHADYRYIYEVTELPERPDRRKCYNFDVRHTRLVTTLEKGAAGSLGYNEMLVIFGEGPSDDPNDYGQWRAACVRAQYVAPSYKYPADGKVTLTPENFMDLVQLQTALAEVHKDPSQKDPCVGAPLP
jgi:hypothetical protein